MKKNDSFLVFCCISIVLIMFVFGIKIITKETEASFGGITGSFGNGTKVIYHSNYPDVEMESKYYEYEGANSYKILPNMFLVPDGYQFSGWGLYETGPVLYNAEQYINVSFDINLYAIWEELIVDILFYGDADLDGIVSMDDAKLIDNYIIDNSILSGHGLINADVNVDGKVDNIDSDIIKQVCLGTDGYVGFLPDKPILIYELFVKEEKEEDSDDNSSVGSDGSGTSGNGNASSNSNGGKPSSSTNNSNKKPSVNKDDSSNKDKVEEKKKYNFKFINDNLEYANTECDVLDDDTCMLVLPNTIPSKEGYKFSGWSLEVNCSNNIIKDSISVDSDNTFYACFSKNKEERKDKKNNFNEWLIVGLIWTISLFLIYRVISNFKMNSN